jgi:hypothetical protein
MCTLVILRRPGHDWPLLLAGNRDEMRSRAWRAPARHWADRPEVIAGRDELAGGSWLGINDHGVVAVVMNRLGTLGPEEGKRSRGELVLEALDHAAAAEAAAALGELDPRAYRPFNLFIGDPASAFWLAHRGANGEPGGVQVAEVPEGLHMLTAQDLDDAQAARIRIHLPQFRSAPVPDPARGAWDAWQALLASRAYPEADGPLAAMNLDLPKGFATVCSQLLAIPRYPGKKDRPVFLFAAGPPDRAPFQPAAMD